MLRDTAGSLRPRRPQLFEDREHSDRHDLRRLVLPEPQDGPADFVQCLVVATVTSDVAVELGLPPRAVGLRVRSVLWTPMPEAPVDEDRQPVSRECDVDATSKAGDGA